MENRALGGHIISFSAQNTLFCRKRPRPDLSGEALAAPSPACTRSVRSPQRPIRLPRRPAWLSHDPAPFGSHIVPPGSFVVPLGSFVVPLGSRMIPPHPHAGTTATPLSRCPHHPTPVLASLRQPLLSSGRATKETGTKKSAFFWSIRKIFTTFTTYCSDNLVSAPQRFARRIRLSSHPGIPMTGDVPAVGSEQHTETTYLSIFNQKTQKHEKIRHPSPDVVLCAHCRSAG